MDERRICRGKFQERNYRFPKKKCPFAYGDYSLRIVIELRGDILRQSVNAAPYVEKPPTPCQLHKGHV